MQYPELTHTDGPRHPSRPTIERLRERFEAAIGDVRIIAAAYPKADAAHIERLQALGVRILATETYGPAYDHDDLPANGGVAVSTIINNYLRQHPEAVKEFFG